MGLGFCGIKVNFIKHIVGAIICRNHGFPKIKPPKNKCLYLVEIFGQFKENSIFVSFLQSLYL
jgi:hypothetical protein